MSPSPPSQRNDKHSPPGITGKTKNSRTVSWYPGHMVSAQRALATEVKTADLVLEMRDARLPLLSANPYLAELVHPSKRLILLNKANLADAKASKQWEESFAKGEVPAMLLDAEHRSNFQRLYAAIQTRTVIARERFSRRGIRPPPMRVMVVGMPNVGKSTLINRMLHRNRLPTAPIPGITRGVRWVQLRNKLLLMDSPGLMLPRIDDEQEAFHLGWIGALPDAAVGTEKLGRSLASWMLQQSPESFIRHYQLHDQPLVDGPAAIEALAKRLGLLISGGIPDLRSAAETLLLDFRAGRLGRHTLQSHSLSA